MSKTKVVKCVIVGDPTVGKSAFLLKVITNEFTYEDRPTVLDSYTYDVRLRSGMQVVLSLWDSSGYDDYDRLRAACVYPQTDVSLVCFSVDNYDTLENVDYRWIPQVTHYCPHTPWLLVGMKSDLRAADVHKIDHMVKKAEALTLAQKFGAIGYYECSAKEGIGLDDIINVAAVNGLSGLRPRKTLSSWLWKRNRNSNETVEPPQLAADTKTPQINVPITTVQSQWLGMVNNKYLSDVQFHYKIDCYHGHKIVLCSASELFQQLFEIGKELDEEEESSHCNSWSKERLNSMNRKCINNGAVGAFKNIYDMNDVTIITVNDEQVTKVAFERCLSFLYGGCGDVKNDGDLDDIIAAAELLNLPKLIRVCDNVKNDKEILNPYLTRVFAVRNSRMMEKLFFNKTLYSDITFVVDGQKIPAHCCVLTTRCEVMSAMFSGQFAESTTTEVEIPGVDLDAFMAFLQYLYGDYCPLGEGEVTMILVLANKYCVSRLKALCELYISEIVEKVSDRSFANGELDVIVTVSSLQLNRLIAQCSIA